MTNFAEAIAFAWALVFAKWPIFKIVSNIWCFLERFIAKKKSNVLVECFFFMFLAFLVFDPN